MKFLTPLSSMLFFLCCSFITFGQTTQTLIFELDEAFYDTNYNQFVCPVSYNSPNVVSSIDMSFMFDDTKIEVNEVLPAPQGNIDGFSVNFDNATPQYVQCSAYTPFGSQTLDPVLYILFDKLTSEELMPSIFSTVTNTINQAPANTQIIATDCTTIKDYDSDFDVQLVSTACNDTTNTPILTFSIVGNNPNMPYVIQAFSQSTGVDASVTPSTVIGDATFVIEFMGNLSPNGTFFTFVIENGNGSDFIIEKTIYPCLFTDPCIASGGELTGEGIIIKTNNICPNFYTTPAQNVSLNNCSGFEETMYLLLDNSNEIFAASLSNYFTYVCGINTGQYKVVHYIQCSADTPSPNIYDIFSNNPGNSPNILKGINPYTDLVGGCTGISTIKKTKAFRFSTVPPTFGNDGYISCLSNNSQGISNEFFEDLNFSWSHAADLNSCEATGLGYGNYSLTVTWNDATGGHMLDTVFEFTLQPPLVFAIHAALGATYDENFGGITSSYQENQLLPNEQVFGKAPWYYDGIETIVNPDNTVIDWVLVEVRDQEDNFAVVEYQAALLLDDGRVVGANDFNAALKFYQLSPNKAYHIAIKSRNHIGAMTADAYWLGNNPAIDFREPELVLDGFNQLELLPDETFGLRGGDFDGNGSITVSDLNVYLQQQGAEYIYIAADANCDGDVTESDLNIYLNNAGHIGVFPIRY